MISLEAGCKFPAHLLWAVDPAPAQCRGRGLKIGQRRGQGLAGDVGGNGRLAVTTYAVRGAEPEENVGQLVMLTGGNPERGDQRCPDYGGRRIPDYKRYRVKNS
jgi:hypothetical protein